MVAGPVSRGYVITVKGAVGPAVRAALDGTEVTVMGDATQLRDPEADQAALFGLLQRIQNLGLEVLEVQRAPTESA
jgi:hypothetical protein